MGSQKANFGLRSVGVPPDVAVQNHAVSYQRDSSLTPTLPPISPRSYAGTPQSIRSRPPRASRQSTAVVKEEPVQLISWPGFSQHIVHCKGHWKPEGCNAKQDVNGDAPLNARLVTFRGTRPFVPSLAITARPYDY